MTPRRILIATQTFPPDLGGMERLMGDMAVSALEQGHRVEVFADRIRSGLPEFAAPGLRLERFGGPRPLRRILKRRAIARALREGPPAIVIADSWKSVEALPPNTGPLLVLAHGTELPPEPSARKAARIRAAMARATAIAANSRYTQRVVAGFVDPGDAAMVGVVCPPIRPQGTAGAADRAAVAALVGTQGPVILTLARLEPRKGVDQVIRALPALAARHPGIVHLVAGPGDDRPRLEALAAKLGVAARVRFLGPITDDGMRAALYGAADLLAMPARRQGASVESFGIVYLEAAWHGVPALAGREGGEADAVLDGETGLLCDGADPGAVAAALATLLADPDRLQTMGAQATARVRAEFLWPAVLPRYLNLLEP